MWGFTAKPLAGRRGAFGAGALLHPYGNTVNRVLPESFSEDSQV